MANTENDWNEFDDIDWVPPHRRHGEHGMDRVAAHREDVDNAHAARMSRLYPTPELRALRFA